MTMENKKNMKKEDPNTRLDSLLESLKNKFLAAVYTRDNTALKKVHQEIVDTAHDLGTRLKENDEKILRQVQTAAKKFKPCFPILEKGHKRLQGMLNQIVKAQIKAILYVGYEDWAQKLGLEPWQKERLFQTAITFQMTKGCSNFCRRCNEWALPGVRAHFSRSALDQFLEKFTCHNNKDLALYGASDPLDWEDPPHAFNHILPGNTTGYSILTKAPRGKKRVLKSLIKTNINFSVSLTSRNRDRIRDLEEESGSILAKQHDTQDLLIPAGLDEDFATVKPSITDGYGSEITPDGAFIILPTFTSALHPFGHQKIPITRNTEFFPVKKLGRPALLQDYFKPLEVLGKNNTPFFLGHLLDVQVENILLDSGGMDLTPPGMRSIKEYFEVFEDTARIQRKKMTRSVIRRLKKACLRGWALANLSREEKQAYVQKLAAHLNFTRKSQVVSARVSAAAFFLAAIRKYLSVTTPKTQIIAHLTQKEFEDIRPRTGYRETCLTDLFSDPAQDAWKLFRYHALGLVHGQSPHGVDQFISAVHASYDPISDRFITQGNV